MKIVRYRINAKVSYGILDGEIIKPIEGELYEDFSIGKETLYLKDVELVSPCVPSKIIGIGLNYYDAAKKNGLDIPKEPIVFLKAPSSVIGPNEKIIQPEMSQEICYEVELAIVVGKRCKDVKEETALDYVLGYTIANDVTAKDVMARTKPWALAKSFDTFTPLGPVIETELNPMNVNLRLCVNGVLKQDGNTKDIIFGVPKLISYLSKVMTLEPGDVILTGTPYGGGLLSKGDVLKMEIEGIGSMINYVD
jgi:2-keto-4-pentenoate hydratase/2-oxohepta-3-ene-1,7-dioic acid hydratase in catechol pathway